MAKLPAKKTIDPFDKVIDGVFGRFKTSDSYGLYYLMATVSIDELKNLEAATDALPFEHINFDELVQRDVDYGRVDDEIIKDYLEQGKDRVLFFPPLLVAPIVFEDNKPAEKYSGFEDDISEEPIDTPEAIYSATWGKDKFKLELPLQTEDTRYKIRCEKNDKDYFYINYAASLKYNTRKVKLVVIDGQHRLIALKRIIERGQVLLINGIELPICVFFPPNPGKSSGEENESLIRDMRELFITINTTAKEVSGHFTVLLNDNSLSALCARDLADFWKKKPLGNAQSYLHMLEWNERSSKKARQRNRKYSITTITAIADCFRYYLFQKKNGGLASVLLNLRDIKNELDDVGDVSYGAINEDEFSSSQSILLKEQAREYITPSLDILFSQPSPYKEIENSFISAVSWLNVQVANSITGTKQYRDDVLFKFRTSQQHDQQAVKDIETEFESKIEIMEDNDFYFLNIFQQSLIRSWAILSKHLANNYSVHPKDTALALVSGLEKLCFSSREKFFDEKKDYTQRVIFKGAQLIVNETSRYQLVNLVLSTLLHNATRTEIINKIKADYKDIKEEPLGEYLKSCGVDSAKDYLDAYTISTKAWLKKEYRFVGYDDATVNMLEQLGEGEEFNEEIERLTAAKQKKSRDVLSNMLGVDSKIFFERNSSKR